MNIRKHYELIVIGAGPGGMAAAISAKRSGVSDILILERRDYIGGILPQCIHDGFGLYLYQKSLTGPEYAAKWAAELKSLCIQIKLCTTALNIFPIVETTPSPKKKWLVSYLGKKEGLVTVSTDSIVIATGCREKTLSQLHIPGSRPSGVYTAGSAQYMMNIQNYLPGKTAVILGSGDIGLIMARRMTLEGIHVKLILGQKSTGLVRNLVQCVEDFDIPMKYGFTVVSVHGYKRLKGVTIAPVNEDGQVNLTQKEYIHCDTLLIAAGLIPELDLCRDSRLIPDTQMSLILDDNLCIGQDGIFACGNAVRVHDLADSVTYEGQKAGVQVAKYLLSEIAIPDDLKKQIDLEITEPKGIVSLKADLGDNQKQVTCILCPAGCQVVISKSVKANSLKVASDYHITGFGCQKGKTYSLEEFTDPKRTVTTSVKIYQATHPLLAVRTDIPVSKNAIPSVIAAARKFSCCAPIVLGTVLIENVAGTGANLISTNEVIAISKEKAHDD